MAKKSNLTVSDIVSVLRTGLEEADQAAFEAYLGCELGALRKMVGDDVISGFKLSGKGDKSKGTLTGAKVDFKGGHNTATVCIHFACLMLSESGKLGILPFTVDVSEYCANWKARRDAKARIEAANASTKTETVPA